MGTNGAVSHRQSRAVERFGSLLKIIQNIDYFKPYQLTLCLTIGSICLALNLDFYLYLFKHVNVMFSLV